MADLAVELKHLVDRFDTIASEGLAVPMAEALADTWVKTAQQEVPVDTGQTKARTAVQSVIGTVASARATVISDTPYAGWVEVRWKPYWTMGREAALALAKQSGGEIGTMVKREIQSGGVWNPRRLFNP